MEQKPKRLASLTAEHRSAAVEIVCVSSERVAATVFRTVVNAGLVAEMGCAMENWKVVRHAPRIAALAHSPVLFA